MELLAILVRQTANIKGISVAERQVKISQYADDATIFLHDFTALNFLLQLLHTFAALSGHHINCHKSHLLLLGDHFDPPTQCKGIQIREQRTMPT